MGADGGGVLGQIVTLALPSVVAAAQSGNLSVGGGVSQVIAVALAARHWGNVLQAGLSIASVLYGALLGVFLLGVLTRRVGESSAIVGMIAGLASMIYVRFATSIARCCSIKGSSTTRPWTLNRRVNGEFCRKRWPGMKLRPR